MDNSTFDKPGNNPLLNKTALENSLTDDITAQPLSISQRLLHHAAIRHSEKNDDAIKKPLVDNLSHSMTGNDIPQRDNNAENAIVNSDCAPHDYANRQNANTDSSSAITEQDPTINNKPKKPYTDITTACVIKLDMYQHAFYQEHCLEIQSPTGFHLDSIGRTIKKYDTETANYHLQNELCLVDALLANINTGIELPKNAVMGLSDLLNRAQQYCEENNN